MACTAVLGFPVYTLWSLASHPAPLGLSRMHVKHRPPQEVGGASGVSHTLRLLLLPKSLTHLALPGSLRGHLSWDSGLRQSRKQHLPEFAL